MRKFYAAVNVYDARVDWDSAGWSFWAFNSKIVRDKFVDAYEFDDRSGNFRAIAVNKKFVDHVMGERWVISQEGRICKNYDDAIAWDKKIRKCRTFDQIVGYVR